MKGSNMWKVFYTFLTAPSTCESSFSLMRRSADKLRTLEKLQGVFIETASLKKVYLQVSMIAEMKKMVMMILLSNLMMKT
jgi:hypothetical protein